MRRSRVRFGKHGSKDSKAARPSGRRQLSRAFEPLEPRWLLSETVGVGAPVIYPLYDPTATAATQFTASSTNAAGVTATALKTAELLKMQVHTVNPDGSVGTSGEMDFLLLDDYAPNNIAHITTLANSPSTRPGTPSGAKFYDGVTFHRILQTFMIQGGDPEGDGRGGSGARVDGPSGTTYPSGQTQDDEFNPDLRFTSNGLLALANSGPDTNDCQFFITTGSQRFLDYGYTIIGKLVAGSDSAMAANTNGTYQAGEAMRLAIASVPTHVNPANSGDGASSPNNPPIIDSVTIVSAPQYGLVLVKGLTVGQNASVSISTNDGSTVELTGTDGGQVTSLSVTAATDSPQSGGRAASFAPLPDINTTMNQPVTVPLPAMEQVPGTPLTYDGGTSDQTNLLTTASGTGPNDGQIILTPQNNIVGVYGLAVTVYQTGIQPDFQNHTNLDWQQLPVFIHPVNPGTISVVTSGVTDGGTTTVNKDLTFHVTGVTPKLTVAIFADDGTTPIGTATVPDGADSVDVPTTYALTDGSHKFVAKQSTHYAAFSVSANRTVPEGDLYSLGASANTVQITVAPTAVLNAGSLAITKSSVTFDVSYTAPQGLVISRSTIAIGNIQVVGSNGFNQLAALVSVAPDADGSPLVATYRIDAPSGTWGPADAGSYTIKVLAGGVRDGQGTAVVDADLGTFNIHDMTPVDVAINQAATQADPTPDTPIHFTVVFSKPVKDFASTSVTFSGTAPGVLSAAVTQVGSDRKTYDVSVTGMSGAGTVVANVAANTVHDDLDNANNASTATDNGVTYAPVGPIVTITPATGQKNPTNAKTQPINFTVVFSEAVTDFTAGSITLTGTAGAETAVVTGSGTTYNVAVTMPKDGTVIVSIPAGKVHDGLGKGNSAGTSVSVALDTTAPTVTVAPAGGKPATNASPVNFTVTFSEPVTGFAANALSFTGSTAVGPLTAAVTQPSGSDGSTYNVAVTGMQGDGFVSLSVLAGKVQDLAGNLNAAGTSARVNYDTTAPTVTIAPAQGQKSPTDDPTINFTVVFNEPVIGFYWDVHNVTLGGTATGSHVDGILPVGTDGTTYTVVVRGMTGDGTVTATVSAGATQDAAGNANTAAPAAATVVFDHAPTVTVSSANGQAATNTVPLNFSVAFSKPVTGFAADAVVLSGVMGNLVANVTPAPNANSHQIDGTTYNVAVTGMTGQGFVYASILPGKAKDAVGNLNLASAAPGRITYDIVPPTATITPTLGQKNPTKDQPINFTIVFSEPVFGFGASTADVALSGTAGGQVNSITPVGTNGTAYTVSVSGITKSSGSVIVAVAAGKAHDAAGNLNPASLPSTVIYDALPPTVTVALAQGQASTALTSPVNFTVTFSQPVVDFVAADVNVPQSAVPPNPSNGIAPGTLVATITPAPNAANQIDGTTYNVAVSGMTGDGTVTISIPAGNVTSGTGVHDAAGNVNAASTTVSATYDTPPTVTLEQKKGTNDPTNDTSKQADFTVTFSKKVTDFTASDVNLQTVQYRLTDLGTLGGDSSFAYAINNSGQVVGQSGVTGQPSSIAHAFLYNGAQLQDLGLLSTMDGATALGIGDNGQVIGVASSSTTNSSGNNPYHAFLYNGSTLVDLGQLLGLSSTGGSVAYDMNQNGLIVGNYISNINSSASGSTAFLYNSNTNTKINLGSLSGSTSNYAYAVNNSGQVAGQSNGHAFAYGGAQMFDLGTLPGGSTSIAYGINDSGLVVGQSDMSLPNIVSAFLYSGGQMIRLGTLGGSSSAAYGINNSGEIVGVSQLGIQGINHAFLYAGGGMTDLNELLDTSGGGWQVTDARSINDAGQIAATGINADGKQHALLLTPVVVPTNFTVSVSPASIDGTTYDVSVSGLTGNGQLVATIAAGVAHDAAPANNANTASTSTDNRITFDYTPPGVTVNQAKTQTDPTTDATVHFTVTFGKPVKDFTAANVVIGGTAPGKLTATVTGSGVSYDVAVAGMTGSGTVVLSVPAGKVSDALGNFNATSTATDNSVQFNLAQKPTFLLTNPASGSYTVGQTIPIQWTTTNTIANTKISLCYDADTTWWNGNEHWIEIDQLNATATTYQNYGTWNWDTTGVAPGKYYIGGYLFANGPVFSHLGTPITIVAPTPGVLSFSITSPTSGSFGVGQTIPIRWSAQNIPAGATFSKISLCYDSDTRFWDGNEHWLEIDQLDATNGSGSYNWNTSNVAPGTYYMAGYMNINGKPVYSHLSTPITIAKPAFGLTSPTAGIYSMGSELVIQWSGINVPAGSTVSYCYSTNAQYSFGSAATTWFKVDDAILPTSGNYNSGNLHWTPTGVTPGVNYYVGAYIYFGGAPVYAQFSPAVQFQAAPALTLAPQGEQPSPGGTVLNSQQQLTPIVNEAIQRLQTLPGASQTLAGVSVQLADLPGMMLGEEVGKTILIDRDAAGYGWFVDPTPQDDSEFTLLSPGVLEAKPGTAAAHRVDLLTTVMHELGHVLGFEHTDSVPLMSAALPLGERRLLGNPAAAALLLASSANPSHRSADLSALDTLFASFTGPNRNWSWL